MLQSCVGLSENPYYIQPMDINVHSLEELNYFVYNHMNLVYREFFCEDLYHYLANDLNQTALSAALRTLDEAGGSVQELILCLLKESYYYDANDISLVSDMLSNINNMSKPERMMIEAQNLLGEHRYTSALRIYEEILKFREKDGLSSAFYGKVAFAIGIVYARLFKVKEANSYFAMAHEFFPDEMYVQASVYLSMLMDDEEELLGTIMRFQVQDGDLAVIKSRVSIMKNAVENAQETQDFMMRFTAGREYEEIIEAWKNDYATMLS